MKLAFLNSIEADTFGGMEQWIRLVSDGLIRRGHQITLIGRPKSRYLERVYAEVPEVHIAPVNISGDFNPFTVRKIRRILTERQIDVLSVNFNKDVRLGGMAARQKGDVRIVWSVGINIAKDKLSHRLFTPRFIDHIIVPSQALKSEITQYDYIDDSKVEVIPIGIEDGPGLPQNPTARETLRDKYRLAPDSIVAVTVGRFVYKKGHEYLIDAAPHIVERFPNIRFLFCGNGPKEKTLRAQIESLALKDHFVFAGMLDNIDLELAGADLMIHPSKEEPFGIALLEGMRARLPIIASRVGGIPEVVSEDETALLFEPRNSAAIAEAATKMLADPSTMKRMGSSGYKRWQSKFKYDTMIDRVEKAFLAVLAGNRRDRDGSVRSEPSAKELSTG